MRQLATFALIFALMLGFSTVEARDTIANFSIEDALARGEDEGVLDSSIKLYFGDQEHPAVVAGWARQTVPHVAVTDDRDHAPYLVTACVRLHWRHVGLLLPGRTRANKGAQCGRGRLACRYAPPGDRGGGDALAQPAAYVDGAAGGFGGDGPLQSALVLAGSVRIR